MFNCVKFESYRISMEKSMCKLIAEHSFAFTISSTCHQSLKPQFTFFFMIIHLILFDKITAFGKSIYLFIRCGASMRFSIAAMENLRKKFKQTHTKFEEKLCGCGVEKMLSFKKCDMMKLNLNAFLLK